MSTAQPNYWALYIYLAVVTAAAYALAADRYIRDTGDDQIVEEPVLADTL